MLASLHDVRKAYQRGGENIDVLRGVSVDDRGRRFPRADGAVGLRQDDAVEPASAGSTGRPAGTIEIAGERLERMSQAQLGAWRARHVGFVFQMYNLLPDADGGAQRRTAAAADQVLGARSGGSAWRSRSVPSAWPIARIICRGSCRAVRNSASASRAPSSATRRCCCATSRPATSTARPATRSSTCCST